MSYYTVLAIFNEVQLVEVESVLNQMVLMNQGDKNQLEKAVDDYHYLLANLQTTRGLTQQIILFLLDETSVTPEGVDLFLSKLEVWLVILENKKEQRIYAEIVNKYRDIVYCFDEIEVLAFRSELINILHELDEIKADRKVKKRHHSWEVHDLTRYEAPMQFQPDYDGYELHMKEYGQSFESGSFFNSVPNLKEKFNEEQPSYEEAFESYFMRK